MITIGLTTWKEHPSLIKEKRPVQLTEYAAFFPLVEIDNTFYGIPTKKTVRNWLSQVPSEFQFILKANRDMTTHPREPEQAPITETQRDAVFNDFQQAVRPMIARQQLKTVLFQFPPFFNAILENIEYLRHVRQLLPTLPIAVEFRNQTWYDPAIYSQVIAFLQELNMTLVAADEPDQTSTSVPFDIQVTNPKLVMLRLHGQNTVAWAHPGRNWRTTRTKYRYNPSELNQFKNAIDQISSKVDEVVVVFNNNAGKDAADNALQFKDLLGLTFTGLNDLPPEQLDLF